MAWGIITLNKSRIYFRLEGSFGCSSSCLVVGPRKAIYSTVGGSLLGHFVAIIREQAKNICAQLAMAACFSGWMLAVVLVFLYLQL